MITSQREEFLEEFKKMIPILIVVAVIQIGLGFLLKNKTVYVTQTEQSNHPSIPSFCRIFGEQLVSKKVQVGLIHKSIYQPLIAKGYEILEFKGKEAIFNIIERDPGCRIVIKDDLGFRAFDLKIDKSNSHEFGLKVTEFSEAILKGES